MPALFNAARKKRLPGTVPIQESPSKRSTLPLVAGAETFHRNFANDVKQAESKSQQIPSTDRTKHNHGHGQAHVEECVEPVGFVMHAATVGAPNTVMSFSFASWALHSKTLPRLDSPPCRSALRSVSSSPLRRRFVLRLMLPPDFQRGRWSWHLRG